MNTDLCRICYENIGTAVIFNKQMQGVQISTKLMYCCANIHINKEDGLPLNVCGSCEQELSLAYQFVLKCEATDKKLQTLMLSTKDEGEVELEVKLEDSQMQFEDKLDSNPYVNTDGHQECEDPITSNVKAIKTAKGRGCRVWGRKKCKICGKQCINSSALLNHLKTHSEDRPFTCVSCNKKYKDSQGLKRHIHTNHNHERKRDFMCETCGKTFFTKYEVKTHMRTHTGETPYACSDCPLKFTQAGSLVIHQLRRHTDKKNHECLKCQKSFYTKRDLTRHQVAHSPEKKFACTICNSLFKYSTNLRKHFLQHAQVNNFICDYCGRAFNLKGNLQMHIGKVHSGKAGFCGICSKDVSDIEVHMWKHSGKKPFQCDLCPSSFFEKKALTRHINFRHKCSDKYKCMVDGCSGTFPSQPMLEYHAAKFHGSGVPFPCDGCSKGFYRKSDLARHKLSTHREKLGYK